MMKMGGLVFLDHTTLLGQCAVVYLR